MLRTRHPSDRRTNLIYLTEDGRNMKETLKSMGQKAKGEVTQDRAPEEIEACIRVLIKSSRNFTEANASHWLRNKKILFIGL